MASVKFEDLSNPNGFFLVDDQPPSSGIDVIAEHGCSPHPLSLAPCRRHLVAGALADDLPLKLGKGEQNIEREAAKRSGRVELLRYRNEGNRSLIELVHQPGEIEKRTAQAVNLIYNHAIEATLFDVFEQ